MDRAVTAGIINPTRTPCDVTSTTFNRFFNDVTEHHQCFGTEGFSMMEAFSE